MFKHEAKVENGVIYTNCLAKNKGCSTVCLVYNNKHEQSFCDFYEKKSRSTACLWLGHGCFCQSLKAQKYTREV